MSDKLSSGTINFKQTKQKQTYSKPLAVEQSLSVCSFNCSYHEWQQLQEIYLSKYLLRVKNDNLGTLIHYAIK